MKNYSKDKQTEISVKIKVPTDWLNHPDKKYDKTRDKIYKNWALTVFLTGHRAEDWLWEEIDKNKSMYENHDGKVWFFDAIHAIERIMQIIIEKHFGTSK